MQQLLSLCLVFTLLGTYTVLASNVDAGVLLEPLLERREVVLPLFAWSDGQLFTSKNAEIEATLTQGDIEDCLYTLLHLRENVENTKLQVLNVLPSAPEVLVVFVEPELRTDTISKVGAAYTSQDGGSFTNLNNILSGSAATLTAPYVTYSSYSSLLAPLIHVSEDLKQGSVLVVRDGDSSLFGVLRQLSGVQTISVDNLFEYLKTHNEIFNDGMADVIVVAFDNSDQLAEHDTIIGQVSAYVSQKTSGKYVGIYTANSPALTDFVWTFPGTGDTEGVVFPEYPRIMGDIVGNSSNQTNTTTSINYFPGALLEAFMVVIPLIIMLFVGTCGIMHLQVPERYESPKIVQKSY